MNINRALFPLLVFLGGCSFGPLSPIVKIAYEDGYSSVSMIFAQYGGGWFSLFILVLIFTIGRMLIGKNGRGNTRDSAKDTAKGNLKDILKANTKDNGDKKGNTAAAE